MPFLSLCVVVPFPLGIVLFAISLVPLLRLLHTVQGGWLRRSWMVLGLLIALFIVGYAYVGVAEFRGRPTIFDLVIATIALLGACFVCGVTLLSHRTMLELAAVGVLAREAFIDPLTGLRNRLHLDEMLCTAMTQALDRDYPLALMIIDLDHFKLVNDRYGHAAGDDVLRRVGERLIASARPPDTLVRYGGEEILLLAPHTDIDDALSLAERLRASIHATVFQPTVDTTLSVSCSIGVASLRTSDTANALVGRADQALYRAKRGGRNRVCTNDLSVPTMDSPPREFAQAQR